MNKSVVMIHPFQVEEGAEQQFLTAWQAVDDYMRQQIGFVETKLHRSLNINALTTFSFVNVARWQNLESFQNAISTDYFQRLVKGVLVFSRGPGIYEIYGG
jgi:heme oxygenase (mycobilin-producing)